VQGVRNFWKSIWSQNAVSISGIRSIPAPEKNSTIYITGKKGGVNVFIYGPGYINRIFYSDQSLKTVLGPKPDNVTTHYLIWKLSEDGTVIETQRKN